MAVLNFTLDLVKLAREPISYADDSRAAAATTRLSVCVTVYDANNWTAAAAVRVT